MLAGRASCRPTRVQYHVRLADHEHRTGKAVLREARELRVDARTEGADHLVARQGILLLGRTRHASNDREDCEEWCHGNE